VKGDRPRARNDRNFEAARSRALRGLGVQDIARTVEAYEETPT
jgi:hypothetical protein